MNSSSVKVGTGLSSVFVTSVIARVESFVLIRSEGVFETIDCLGDVFFVEAKLDGVAVEDDVELSVVHTVHRATFQNTTGHAPLGAGNDEVLGTGLRGGVGFHVCIIGHCGSLEWTSVSVCQLDAGGRARTLSMRVSTVSTVR